ncbi:hypothetical protein BDZ89DRAFT_1088489 [Hymenopellis radicata]|nr:hypothetical protein BDZ89DRAFT_1088489 [Hymenopellis radicata]
MATTARQPKPMRKGGPPEPTRNAWNGARASPTFTASSTSARPASQAPQAQGAFPPLAQGNGVVRADDAVLRSLSGLTGTTITLTTKTSIRYEGVIFSTSGEGDTMGVTLKDVKEISDSGAPLKDQLFIASTNIETWASGPADAKLTNGETFRTDADISQKKGAGRERELQAWQPDAPVPANAQLGTGDDLTFGPGSNNHSWDQFVVNESLFGVKTSFDEELYTTKLDRSGADFKERERKAQKIANEIVGATSSNPHIAEERNQADDSGINEEDKYGAVVRGTNAYVPPGARKPGAPPAASNAAKSDVPKVSVNGPEGAAAAAASQTQSPPSSSKGSSPAPSGSAKPPADAVPAFREFVSSEKQRLAQKRQALVKNEMDKRMADLVKFSQSFKLNKPIPEDLVPILAKDEEKQKAIKEKANKDAASVSARNIGSTTPAGAPRAQGGKAANMAEASRKAIVNGAKTTVPPPPSAVGQKPSAATTKDGGKKSIAMVIQPIPPFKGARKPTAQSATAAKTNGAVASPANVQESALSAPLKAPASPSNRLNVNASSFRPNPKASAFTPTSAVPNNPFFGTRVIKKTPVNIKDDFNPFKHSKVVDASHISASWPYNGKRYMQMYPTPQHQPPQHSPHMGPPVPPPMPPPSYEEDSAAQAAARGYVFYPHYGYPGQPMMPGMAPPGPPGAYMPGPFMQPMPYPPGMPPNAMYAPPGMQMPRTSFTPSSLYAASRNVPASTNGAGPRQSMPPTPIPQHAHTYYHQSPQLQHAVPYQMMMPPPPPNVPHGYEGAPTPQQMGGHA